VIIAGGVVEPAAISANRKSEVTRDHAHHAALLAMGLAYRLITGAHGHGHLCMHLIESPYFQGALLGSDLIAVVAHIYFDCSGKKSQRRELIGHKHY